MDWFDDVQLEDFFGGDFVEDLYNDLQEEEAEKQFFSKQLTNY